MCGQPRHLHRLMQQELPREQFHEEKQQGRKSHHQQEMMEKSRSSNTVQYSNGKKYDSLKQDDKYRYDKEYDDHENKSRRKDVQLVIEEELGDMAIAIRLHARRDSCCPTWSRKLEEVEQNHLPW